MGRAAGDIEVNRDKRVSAVMDFRVAPERPAADGAGSAGNRDLRLRDRLPGFEKRFPHMFADRAGHKDAVSVTGRGDELDAEPAQIEADRIEDIGVSFTGVAAACRDFTQFQGATEKLQPFLFQGPCPGVAMVRPDDQLGTGAGSKLVAGGKADGAMGAGGCTFVAEDAEPHIESKATSSRIRPAPGSFVVHGGNGTIRADRNAGTAAVPAFLRFQLRIAAEKLRQNRRYPRVVHGPVLLVDAGENGFNHIYPLQIKAAVRQVETLVAERKVGDLFSSHCQGKAGPVAE